MSEDTPKIWKYRLGAFIIDLIFIFFLTGFISFFYPFESSDWAEYLIPFISFNLYFITLSIFKNKDYSFGKAMMNISVHYSSESEGYDFKRLLLRVIIIALIWPLNIQDSPEILKGGYFRNILGVIFFSLQYSFVIYNIILAFTTERMLQDRFTYSFVKFLPLDTDESYSNKIEQEGSVFYKPYLLIGLIFVFLSSSFITKQHLNMPLYSESAYDLRAGTDLELLIEDKLGIRNNVRIRASREMTSTTDFNVTTTTDELVINIEIWLPKSSWNSSNRDSIVEIVNQNLKLDQEAFDRYNLEIWTGSGNFTTSRSYTGKI
ncbi:MAG: hypothetical protein Wins2KO_32210 [Winogradskyella sp.]